jgi:hypothetical protein
MLIQVSAALAANGEDGSHGAATRVPANSTSKDTTNSDHGHDSHQGNRQKADFTVKEKQPSNYKSGEADAGRRTDVHFSMPDSWGYGPGSAANNEPHEAGRHGRAGS